MEEVFKDIEGYDGLYMVSNLGRVKSLGNSNDRREKILKTRKNNWGYLLVSLYSGGKCKTCKVHRLVASAFVENPNNFKEVNHIDENKTNNHADNLEWCSREYNVNYGNRNERQRDTLSKPVKCLENGIIYPSAKQAQMETGIFQGNISKCCNGKYKTAGGFHWKFVKKMKAIFL